MEHRDAIIIGSGFGGLTTALCLARAGKKVTVLEQHYVPGGWCHSFTLNGQRFSPGVHYIGSLEDNATTTRLLEGLGVAGDIVFFRLSNKGFEHAQVGDARVTLGVGADAICEELSCRFPAERKGIRKVIDLVLKINEEIEATSELKGVWDYMTVPWRARHLLTYGFWSLKRVLDWHIKDPLLKDILSVQCGDHGLAPSKVSFVCHASLMFHYINGGYYPMGGGGGLVKVMTNAIKKLGGEIRTSCEVKRILVESAGKKKKAVGVELGDGTVIRSECIVSNTDPHKTFFGLVGKEHLSSKLASRITRTTYSLSSLILFLTVDMDVTKAGIDAGNIWMCRKAGLDEQFKAIDDIDLGNEDEFPGMFISCSTLKDPVSFNGRYYNFELVTFVNYDLFKNFEGRDRYQSAEYLAYKQTVCNKFLKSLERVIPGVSDHIVQMELGTPKTNEHYINCTAANTYGTEKNLRQLLFPFRSKTEIENLYLCGASTTSHGVTGVGYSGVNAAAAILNCKPADLLKSSGEQRIKIYDAEHPAGWPEWIHQKMRDKKNNFKEAKVIQLNSYTTADDPGRLKKTGTDR